MTGSERWTHICCCGSGIESIYSALSDDKNTRKVSEGKRAEEKDREGKGKS